jgi:DNA helicase II / ATP-dependent DNA helicase PcrA
MDLNPGQIAAAEYQGGPLLIIAGAGTGKTSTLAHRVAHLILHGADPGRILLLTFTRRASEVMTRRAQALAKSARISWAGTFHAVANRLLRHHAAVVGLDPAFTVLDRSDSADLLNVVRNDLGFSKQAVRFPRKETCLAIYSHAVNAQQPVEKSLERAFPAYAIWADELKQLFRGYGEAKQQRHVLDYDDLLLYWFYLMGDRSSVISLRKRFNHILVDEYQDTNALQAEIILRLATDDGQPMTDDRSLTVVGDDAQSIYSFRAATIRNILDFPSQFANPAHVIKLEENYRSTQPILDASNAVMALAPEGFHKTLYSRKASGHKPVLAAAKDDQAQADFVIDRILEHREAGIALHDQAVLMRTAHHSDLLEIELARRNVPFVKFGGLKFLEAAHVKDVICVLRWAENPRDDIAAFRVLQLLPGMGPVNARKALSGVRYPATAELEDLLDRLRKSSQWVGQLGMVRSWYQPHLERLYEGAAVRSTDLETLESISNNHPSRESFLSEITLDPPEATGDLAGDPLIDDDYLILSTIHSAKGQEWDVVYVLNTVDGCIPSDMATSSEGEIEEERRLLYVAMTRAREHLYLMQPLRFYVRGDRHIYAPRTRFLPDELLSHFEPRTTHHAPAGTVDVPSVARIDVAGKLRELWS